MRRGLAALLLALASLAVTAPVAAQEGSGGRQDPGGHIIPRPNSGEAPEEAGDRGGALQLLVLGLVVVAVAGGIALVVRDSRRSRAP